MTIPQAPSDVKSVPGFMDSDTQSTIGMSDYNPLVSQKLIDLWSNRV